jgi:2-methylcitrate dehydratase
VLLPDFPQGGNRAESDPFRISRTIFKSYPSQIHTQGPIGLAIELRNKVALGDIESIHIDAYGVAASTASTEPEKWDPRTRETADHSIPFLVAAALRDGSVTPATFTDDGIADASLRVIMSKMDLVEDSEFTAKFPQEYNSRITITDRSRAEHTAHTAYSKGHQNNPLDDAEVEAKFRSLSSTVLTTQQCDEALEAIWALDALPDLEELFDSLVV